MLSPTIGVHRVIRALSLGLTCWTVTVLSHSVVGGAHSSHGLALTGFVMFLLAAVATGTELRLPELFAIVAATQVLAHVVLTFMAGSATGSGSGVVSQHQHGLGAMSMLDQMPVDSVTPALPMIGAHAIACLAAAGFLRYGESLYFRLNRVLPEVLRVLMARALPLFEFEAPAVPVSRTNGLTEFRVLRDLLSVREISQRGPPALRFSF